MKYLVIILIFCVTNLSAQYAPAAEKEGSTAFSMHDSRFTDWAVSCTVERGWLNISDTTLGKVTHGNQNDALGIPNPAVVSLGDGGLATLTFENSLTNKEGFDFAVFENSFDDYFLELAFVEVSTNGIDYVRFPSVSLTDTINQVGTFGTIETTKIHNLAGKYRGRFGTPFDLEELKDSLSINVNDINYIRIIDVVGSINNQIGSFDSQGNIINEPFPTPFETGGFDLDAVGVLDESIPNNLTLENIIFSSALISSTRILKGEFVTFFKTIKLFNCLGMPIGNYQKGRVKLNLKQGIYIIQSENKVQKIIIH